MSLPGRSPHGVVTVRDQEFVRYLGRHWAASADQIVEEWTRRGQPVPRRQVYRRMQVCGEHGLVVMDRLLVGRPAVFRVTRDGLALCGLENGHAPRSPIATFDHDAAVVDLVHTLESAGHEVLTERELYATDMEAFRCDGRRPRYCPVTAVRATGEVAAVHVPDAVSLHRPGDGPAEPWAHEVELTLKSATRTARIVRAYRDANHLAGVRYWTRTRVIADAVRAAAAAAWRERPSADGRGPEEVIQVWPLGDMRAAASRPGVEAAIAKADR